MIPELGHQGTDLVGRDGRGQVRRELPEEQLLLVREGRAARRAIEGDMVAEAGDRIDVDHAEQLTDVVTCAKPAQPGGGLHVDGHGGARAGVYQADGDVVVADRFPVLDIVLFEVEQVCAVLHRHAVDQRRAAPPGTLERHQLLQTFQRGAMETLQGLVARQPVDVQHGGAERREQGCG